MEGKKKLAGWQFGILLVLLLLMLSTMFMPLFNVDGKAVEGTISAINKSFSESISDLIKDLKEELAMESTAGTEYSEEEINRMVDEALDDYFNEDGLEDFDITVFFEIDFNTTIDKSEKGYNDFIKLVEKEKGIKLTNISPLYIMSHSYSKFIGGDSKKKEETTQKDSTEKANEDGTAKTSEETQKEDKIANNASLEKVYNSIRTILIVVYVLCVIVLILTIIAFAASWSKTIPTAIDMIYGIFATVMYIIIRSSVPKIIDGVVDAIKNLIGKEIIEIIKTGMNEGMDLSDSEVPQNVIDTVNKVFNEFELKNVDTSSFASSIVKFGFIAALIIAIIIVVFSLISIFIGGKELYVARYMPDDDTSESFYKDDYVGSQEKSENPFGDDSKSVGTTPIVTPPIDNTPAQQFVQQSQQFVQQPQQFVQQPQQFVQQPQQFVQQPQQFGQQPYQTPQSAVGKVVCTKGVAYGQGFNLPVDRKVIVGKSPTRANLVINNQNVSNIHCSVRYNAARNTYIVKDHSTNGTFVNGVRMAKDIPMEYPAGTVLSLADGSNQITLG